MELFDSTYLPAIDRGRIQPLALYALTDETEAGRRLRRNHHKSLLDLVSNALESSPRIPMFRDGVSILGVKHPALGGQTSRRLRR